MTITVDPLSCPTAINPTFIPWAWEGFPFAYTLTVTGGVGPFQWTATGLPAGLTLNPTTGEISGVPGPGTCGLHTVTVKVCDLSQPFPCCCPCISRPFIFFIDCWANHICNTCVSYYGCSACNTCNTCSTPCDCSVEIGTGLEYGQTTVYIDNNYEASLAGGQSKLITSKPCQGRVVSVDQTVPGPTDKIKYVVIGPNVKACTDIDNHAYFNYEKWVYIDTGSDPSGIAKPGVDGWYAVGSDYSATAPSLVDSDSQNGIRYLFKEFSLPDGTTSPNRNLVFTVNKEGSVTAKYDTYFLLTLKSDYPLVNETSWKPEGTATWNLVLQPVPTGDFWGLIGARWRPVNPSGSIELHKAEEVEILWKKDCTIPWIIMVVLVIVVAGLVYYYGFYRRRKPAPEPPTTPAKRKASSKAKKEAAK